MSQVTLRQIGMAVFLACAAIGCGGSPDAESDGLTASDREDYVTEFAGELNDFGARLTGMNEQVDQLPEDQREKWRETAMELEEQQRKVKALLSEFTESTGEKWEEQKAQLDQAIKELEQAYQNAISQFDFPKDIPDPESPGGV